MNNIREEYLGSNCPNSISIEETEQILLQMKYCVCKIHKENGVIGNGFFSNIMYNNNLLQFLVTTNKILNNEDIQTDKIIEITFNDNKEHRKITIDNSRKKYTNPALNITFIEIKKNKDNINYFLDIDNDVYKEKNVLKILFKKKSLYILHYPKGNNIKVSYGLSNDINNYNIHYNCDTEEGSSGSPILSLNSLKLIGIHIGSPNNNSNKYKIGNLINYAIEKFNNQNINDDNDVILNEMTIIYNINYNNDIIYLFGEEFVKNNKEKCFLVINEQKYDLCEYIKTDIIRKDDTNLKIKLEEIIPITNMSYMCYYCHSLASLPDFSNWNFSSVNDISCMFYNCKFLFSLPDISGWDTSNIINMKYLFYNCKSLVCLPNISNWNTSNVKDISGIFADCQTLKTIPDI